MVGEYDRDFEINISKTLNVLNVCTQTILLKIFIVHLYEKLGYLLVKVYNLADTFLKTFMCTSLAHFFLSTVLSCWFNTPIFSFHQKKILVRSRYTLQVKCVESFHTEISVQFAGDR